MRDMNAVVGTHDLLWVSLDTLRWDVADRCFSEGRTPNLHDLLGLRGWERRHSPASFTLAAHQAFFAGFLPTPARPGPHPRPFAVRFPGSETTTAQTLVIDEPDIVLGLRARGYHTVCIGGVGFFDPATPLGRSLTGSFDEALWDHTFGVAAPTSFEAQIACAREVSAGVPADRLLFTFVNVSAIHQPNCHYLAGADQDSVETQCAALAYFDDHLPDLLAALRRTRPLMIAVFSDHGTAYGEDGYHGHRLGHEVVWTVPYGEAVLGGRA